MTGTGKPLKRGAQFSLVVSDVSETGAKLKVENVDQVPDVFRLCLDEHEFSSKCLVVWRGETTVGVTFELPPQF